MFSVVLVFLNKPSTSSSPSLEFLYSYSTLSDKLKERVIVEGDEEEEADEALEVGGVVVHIAPSGKLKNSQSSESDESLLEMLCLFFPLLSIVGRMNVISKEICGKVAEEEDEEPRRVKDEGGAEIGVC